MEGFCISGDDGQLDLVNAGATGEEGDEGVEFPLRLLETSDIAVNFAPEFFFLRLLLFSFPILIFNSPS
jgi:hypothetical protein